MEKEIIAAIVASAVVLHQAIAQYGAYRRNLTDRNTEADLVVLTTGKTTKVSIKIERTVTSSWKDMLPDASAALSALASWLVGLVSRRSGTTSTRAKRSPGTTRKPAGKPA